MVVNKGDQSMGGTQFLLGKRWWEGWSYVFSLLSCLYEAVRSVQVCSLLQWGVVKGRGLVLGRGWLCVVQGATADDNFLFVRGSGG